MALPGTDSKTARRAEAWFSGYVRGFLRSAGPNMSHMSLRLAHTRRVRREIEGLGKSLGLRGPRLRLASLLGLLHDTGRFEQCARHGACVDHRSINHGELGALILKREGVLRTAGPRAREVLLRAIRLHNRPRLPRLPGDVGFFARLIRDADKLDIWRVVSRHVSRRPFKPCRPIDLGLPVTPGFSPKARVGLLKGGIVNFGHLRNLNDLKLLQLSLAYDLNFAPAFRRVLHLRFLEKIRATMPKTEWIDSAYGAVREHARRGAASALPKI